MPEQLEAAAMQEASLVLRRLADLVEEGTLTATAETKHVTAAYWQGAADALSAAAAAEGEF